MRVGSNPFKTEKVSQHWQHQVIVPVFVPHQTAYFEKAFEVTRLCLSSLIRTVGSHTFISIVNNGSCAEVTAYLNELSQSGRIHQLIHFKHNVGQVNAWKTAINSTQAPIVTLSDGDVYFIPQWEQAVVTVYESFPKAAMVSPVPDPRGYRNFTSNTHLDAWYKLKFRSLLKEADLLHFENSLGQKGQHYNHPLRLSHQLTIKAKNGQYAVVGNAHFVATFRREAFKFMPTQLVEDALSGDAHYGFVDTPIERNGFWRLLRNGFWLWCFWFWFSHFVLSFQNIVKIPAKMRR
jgi:glycosyltransferase involved in cell wall biosynthesis